MLVSHDIYCMFRNVFDLDLFFFTEKTKNFNDMLTSKHTMTADQQFTKWLVHVFIL